MNVEAIAKNLYRDAYWRGGAVLMSAISGIEMALWDIKGKALGVPVYQLLGGKMRDSVRIYVNGWFAGASKPEEFGQKAAEAVKRGVTAMKWDPFGKNFLEISNKDLTTALQCVDEVRKAVGPDVELLIEGHGRFDVPTGIKIAKELEQFKPKFFEEPTPPDDIHALKRVRDKSPVPISAGERLYGLRSFREIFDLGTERQFPFGDIGFGSGWAECSFVVGCGGEEDGGMGDIEGGGDAGFFGYSLTRDHTI